MSAWNKDLVTFSPNILLKCVNEEVKDPNCDITTYLSMLKESLDLKVKR